MADRSVRSNQGKNQSALCLASPLEAAVRLIRLEERVQPYQGRILFTQALVSIYQNWRRHRT